MNGRAVFAFELRTQLRAPISWLLFGVLAFIAFLMTRDGGLSEALYDEFFVNSPFSIAKATIVGTLLWLLAAPLVAGEAAARDVATGMHPLVYTVPLSRLAYVGGRLAAALVVNALLLAAVQLGILAAVTLPGLDPTVLGPFRPVAFLTAYAYLSLPTLFAITVLQFALALRMGRPMAAYLGSLFCFLCSHALGLFLYVQGRQDLARLFDPVGVHLILSDLSHLWTSYEKSHRLLSFDGALMQNRLLWLGIGVSVAVWSVLAFRFRHRDEARGWLRRSRGDVAPVPTVGALAVEPVHATAAPRRYGARAGLRQVLAIAAQSFALLARSGVGFAMLVVIPLLLIPVVLDQMLLNGVPLEPLTIRVLAEISGSVSSEMSRWVMIPLLLVYITGELVWRERDARVAELLDTAPVSEWVPLVGKFLGVTLLLAAFVTMQIAAGVVAQAVDGYHAFELGLYARVMYGLQLPEYLLFAALALCVHVAAPQKYVGHVAGILVYMGIALAPLFGLRHDLLIFGAAPTWSFTPMRGFGPTLLPWLAFKAYWAGVALLLIVVARLLWARGRELSWRRRLASARGRLTPATRGVASGAALLTAFAGGFVFYNTNILHAYVSPETVEARQAEYERRYRAVASRPQPTTVATTLNVALHPRDAAADVSGQSTLVNATGTLVDTIHVAVVPGGETGPLRFDRDVRAADLDDAHGHRRYVLAEPLEPGDSLTMSFNFRIAFRGFREGGASTSIVKNGTRLQLDLWLPRIGYRSERELLSPATRRAQGLPDRPLIPSRDDPATRRPLPMPARVWTTVSTDADEVAVAPGVLRRSWRGGDRALFEFHTESGLGDEFVIYSARYAVRETQWRDVAVRIYHPPEQSQHVDGVQASVLNALDYFTSTVGPYRHNALTVVTHPGIGSGMHAEPGVISHSEGFPLWRPREGVNALDFPYAVVAHEMGHQWNVPLAYAEGLPVLSEGIAWYHGMHALKAARGEAQMRQLLRFWRQPYPYPPMFRGEPIVRGIDPYVAYRRTPFALRTLDENIGEDAVHTALRRLYTRHITPGAPPATTYDLMRELRAVTPDSLDGLLVDLFESNTFWQFRTVRASATSLADGEWEVTLQVEARKWSTDSTGAETDRVITEPVRIALYGEPADGQHVMDAVLYEEPHHLRSGRQTITLRVNARPRLAAVDPHHIWDWRESDGDDNLEQVTIPAVAARPSPDSSAAGDTDSGA